jgi:hypothetical protein
LAELSLSIGRIGGRRRFLHRLDKWSLQHGPTCCGTIVWVVVRAANISGSHPHQLDLILHWCPPLSLR